MRSERKRPRVAMFSNVVRLSFLRFGFRAFVLCVRLLICVCFVAFCYCVYVCVCVCVCFIVLLLGRFWI